ncbi:MaoC/PaaZ C-terminal domain-containing protein [Nocardia sp. 348MFTsu5.1]|uniref:MaoC/PaaZ C-terminal domain-containing protein n=1 Tax=Nocardia sp. 348MFTsu5.1 TaxID=1172185 RepID=UPI00037762CA|nr:MaoC/PaaZ C-terminal domain-containing protein [Nocardia sp. 348MFTsu5.1]
MAIDPDIALGAVVSKETYSWNASDVALYNLGVGAGADPLDSAALGYFDDNHPKVLPTFATVAAHFHDTEPPKVSKPGVEIDLANVVHGSQEVLVHKPIPAAGTATTTIRIIELQDKGSAAVIIEEFTTVDDAGEPLWTARSSIFAKGEGGFGGERGESDKVVYPDREPDHVIEAKTLPQQALLYRLCGDRNPLHSDPGFAEKSGFPRPILHGLCTYGTVCRAVVDTLLGGDVDRVQRFGAKFAGVVFPGETLRIKVWEDGSRLLITVTVADRDDAPALGNVVLTTFGHEA